MSLHLYRSNRLEFLAHVLGEMLRESPPADPFDPVRVVVGSRGVARWLRHRLAEQLGICSNVLFPFPAATLDGLVRAVIGAPEQQQPWAPDALAWSVLSELRDLADRPEFAWFRPYLAEDGVVTPRQWGIARQVADVFDRYVTYRPELAVGWSAGRADAPLPEDLAWQPILWKRLAEVLHQPHRADRALQAIAKMNNGDGPTGWSSVRIFGVSSLPPAWLDLIGAASAHIDVELYLLCPSAEYWADLRRRFTADVQWRTLDPDDVEERLTSTDAAGNPLLASLGRQARDFQLILESQPDGYEDQRLDLFDDPERSGATLLHAIQSDALAARAPVVRTLEHTDRSIRLHACHGATRQVEVLRDELLGLFDASPDLHPRDVLVMTPDIATYAPVISAVFGQGRTYRGSDSWGPSGAPHIPFEIADLSARESNPVAEALLRVLDLATGRVRASEVLDWLALAPVRQRFGLSADDLPRIADWVTDSGIRWGIDAAHRARHGQPEDAQNTWEFGIDRLLLGVCLPDEDGQLFQGILPYDAVEGGEAALLGRVVHALRTLFAELADLRTPRLPSEWLDRLAQTVRAVTQVGEDEAWLVVAVNEALDALAQESGQTSAPRPASVQLMYTVLTERFARVAGHAKEQSGAVTFCAMAPMRSVPYRVVCLLGLDDGSLPRVARPAAFDLTDRHPRAGDRDPRDEDRYLFLEAILAARDHLIITWTGRDLRSNEERPPATPLAEFMGVLDQTCPQEESTLPTSKRLTTHHPLQAHSPSNFQTDGPPRSYDRALLAGARTALLPPEPKRPFFSTTSAPSSAAEDISLDELIRFLEGSAEYLLRRRLAVNLRDDADTIQDREPIALDGLERWQLWNQLVQARLSGIPTTHLHEQMAARGTVPLGYAGRQITRDWSVAVDDALAATGLLGPDGTVRRADSPVPIALDLGDARLTGSLTQVWGDQLVHFQFSTESPRKSIRPWVELLAWAASGAAPRSLVAWRDNKKGPVLMGLSTPSDAAGTLQQLISLFRRGSVRPLPLLPRCSDAFAKTLDATPETLEEALADPERVEEAMRRAEGFWAGGAFNRGDGDDPHVAKLFDGRFPGFRAEDGSVDPEFVEAAVALFTPLRACRLTSAKVRDWVVS